MCSAMTTEVRVRGLAKLMDIANTRIQTLLTVADLEIPLKMTKGMAIHVDVVKPTLISR